MSDNNEKTYTNESLLATWGFRICSLFVIILFCFLHYSIINLPSHHLHLCQNRYWRGYHPAGNRSYPSASSFFSAGWPATCGVAPVTGRPLSWDLRILFSLSVSHQPLVLYYSHCKDKKINRNTQTFSLFFEINLQLALFLGDGWQVMGVG